MRLNAFFRLLTSRRLSQSDPDLTRSCSDQFPPITRAVSSSPLEDEQMNPPEMLGLEDPVLGTTSAEMWTHPVPLLARIRIDEDEISCLPRRN